MPPHSREVKSSVDGNTILSSATRSINRKDQQDDALPPFACFVKFSPKSSKQAKWCLFFNSIYWQPQLSSLKNLAGLSVQEKAPSLEQKCFPESFVRSEPLPGELDALLGNCLSKLEGSVTAAAMRQEGAESDSYRQFRRAVGFFDEYRRHSEPLLQQY